MERTPSKPSGIGHPRKIDTETATRRGDDIVPLASTTVPAKCRLASVATMVNEMIITKAAATEARAETRLVLANRITGLGLRENMFHPRTP